MHVIVIIKIKKSYNSYGHTQLYLLSLASYFLKEKNYRKPVTTIRTTGQTSRAKQPVHK